MNAIIRPEGFVIPDSASAIHGITTDRAKEVGINIETALPVFYELKRNAGTLVAHNLDFDRAVISSVANRMGFEGKDFDAHVCFCTMRATTPICKIPNKFSYDEYKWPRLTEAYRHFFGTDFEGAHDALADVRACAAVYFKLMPNLKECLHLDDVSITEKLPDDVRAKRAYEAYCLAVGGKAFNGDPLPDWETFKNDPAKSVQSNAWIVAAKAI